MKTYSQKSGEVSRNWHLYDMDGKILGRAASEIARLLIGKTKPTYTPHIDDGDFVVVINVEKLVVTGGKMDKKIYHRHSGFPGGYKSETLKEKMKKDPTKVIEAAVKGMLPKNKLQTPRLRRLKSYVGMDHPHTNHFETEATVTKKGDM